MINNTSSLTNQELEKVTLGSSPSPSNSSKRNIVLMPSDRSSSKQLQKSQEYITSPLKSPSRIVSARDSLILHLSTIERKSLYNVSTPLICDNASNGKLLKEPKKQLDSNTIKKRTSKLVLATDSLEIIKSTIAMIKETPKKKTPATIKHKKSPKKPKTKQ